VRFWRKLSVSSHEEAVQLRAWRRWLIQER
jgi:hypothetical protein